MKNQKTKKRKKEKKKKRKKEKKKKRKEKKRKEKKRKEKGKGNGKEKSLIPVMVIQWKSYLKIRSQKYRKYVNYSVCAVI